MGYITKKGAQALLDYKYKSGGYSWLDNRMNGFWLACVEFLPMWMAPNLVTLIGFFFMVSCYGIFIQYDVTFKGDIPAWAFYWCGFAHFAYQTLDAIDGKQARRTNSSSALGQLFDHGLDTFSTTVVVTSMSWALKLDAFHAMVFMILCQAGFCAANWKEYHTDILNTHVANIGVTEVQDTCILVYLWSGLMGAGYFHQVVYEQYTLQQCILYPIWAGSLVGFSILFFQTITQAKHKVYALA